MFLSLHKVAGNGANHDAMRDLASPWGSNDTNTSYVIYGWALRMCEELQKTFISNGNFLPVV